MESVTTPEITFKQIFKRICESLGDVKNISKKFSELTSDEERFKLTSNETCNDFISNLNFKRVNKSYQNFSHLSKVGDSCVAKHEYWEALRAYNESIAFAPAGSEHLALAFFKRSHILSRLSFPKEAGDDCANALLLAETDCLKEKLKNHKEIRPKTEKNSKNECLIGNGDVDGLNGEKSNFFDSASKSVGFFCNDTYSRHLIAKDDIKTGEVLIVEKPYASVLLLNNLYDHCSHCFKRSLNLKPCNGCSFAMFCDENCRVKSQDYHNVECKILDILVSLKLERMELLSLRILLLASKQGKELQKLYEKIRKQEVKNNICEKNQIYKSLDFINIYNLVTNTEKRTVSDLFYRSVISVVLIHLLKKYTLFFTSMEKETNLASLEVFCGGLILHFMQNLPCNAHEVSEFCEDGFNEIGGGAYATLSLINHSCDPNVVRYSCGDVIVLRAIKPIKRGEQIFDSYGYHYATHSFTERQTALMKQYYFKCECEACTQLWPSYELLPSENVQFKKSVSLEVYNKKTEKFEKSLREIFKGNFNSATIEENMKYLDFLDEFIVRPWQNYNKCQEAIKHCLSFSGNHFRFSKGVLC